MKLKRCFLFDPGIKVKNHKKNFFIYEFFALIYWASKCASKTDMIGYERAGNSTF